MFSGIRIKSINNIKWRELQTITKIRYVVFDKDETITDFNKPEILDTIKMDTFRELFRVYKTNVFMLSNNRNHLLDEAALQPLKSEIDYELRDGRP